MDVSLLSWKRPVAQMLRQMSSRRVCGSAANMDDLPGHFDLVVAGTGLTETILAAAASRAGKTVLQLDKNAYYGSEWASFSLSQFEEWVETQPAAGDSADVYRIFSNVELATDFDCKSEWTHEKLKSMANKITIDLCPRLVFSKGAIVDLLVQSNVCRYLEFKNCTGILLHESDMSGEHWISVPCTRDTVFSDTQLSLVQKRKFMKFIDSCVQLLKAQDELDKLQDIPFDSFLRSRDLDDRLINMVKSVIQTKSTDTRACLQFMERFIESAGRFGPTPFLWTLYGSGELPQAFARLTAVFGGVCCLNQEVRSIDSRDDVTRVTLAGRVLTCKFVAGSVSSLPLSLLSLSEEIRSSHAVCITNRSISGTDNNEIKCARMSINGCGVSLIEVDSTSLSVCSGLFIVYMSCLSQHATAKDDLSPFCEKLFGQNSGDQLKPRALWSCFFNKRSPQQVSCNIHHVFAFKSASLEVDYHSHVAEAKAVFHAMFPAEAFLPRAPDAEDIVIDDERDEQRN